MTSEVKAYNRRTGSSTMSFLKKMCGIKYELVGEPHMFTYNAQKAVELHLSKEYPTLSPKKMNLYKKYAGDLNGEYVTVPLYRIRALRDIPLHGVKAGDLGGYVSHKGILSQEESAWIADSAVVIDLVVNRAGKMVSSTRPYLTVRGNAIISGRSTVISRVIVPSKKWEESNFVASIIENYAVIDGSNFIYSERNKLRSLNSFSNAFRIKGQIRGNNYILSPKEIDGNISGTNTLFERSTVVNTASIEGSSIFAFALFMSGQSSVKGRSIIGPENLFTFHGSIEGNVTTGIGCTFTDNAFVSGNVIMGNNNEVQKTANISDDVTTGSGCRFTANAKVFGKAKIGNKVMVTDHVEIGGNAVIEDKNFLQGIPSRPHRIIGDSVVPTPEKLRTPPASDKANSKTPKAIQKPSVPESIIAKHKSILEKIDSYNSDIVKVLKYPVFTDSTNEITLDMMIALDEANDISPHENPEEYTQAVKELNRAFMRAEANAKRLCDTGLGADEVKRLNTAQTLFAMVVDASASDTEKRNAFTQGMKAVKGIVAVPDASVHSLRQRSGLLELEA